MSRPSSRLNFWSVPPSSTSASHRHRVVALQQRVEQLEHRDRLAGRVALGEVVALEDLGHGGRAHEREQVGHRHVEPLAVEADLQPLGSVEHLERLLLERRGVGVDLLAGRAPGGCSERPLGSPDAGRVVADDQDDGVAEVLELAQLLQHDGEPEVDVGRGRVDPELDAQRPARAASLRSSPPVGQAVDGVAGQPGRLLGGVDRRSDRPSRAEC